MEATAFKYDCKPAGKGCFAYDLLDRATSTAGNIEQAQSFDAWGNMRDPDTWQNPSVAEPVEGPMFDRGYTGHEHIPYMGYINMNGRVYDPVMSSFISVDNYVQQPDNSQNFNRYAYCLNNPLKYTDPSGELFGIDDIMFCMIVGGISSVAINGVANSCNGRNFYDGSFGAFMGGVTSVGAGGVMGGVAAGIVGGTEGFVCGGVVGALGGLAGGFAGGYVGTWCNGGSPQECLAAGIIGGAIGMGAGFVCGGIQGGIYAKMNGGNFWSGAGIECARKADPTSPWTIEMQDGMEYSTDFLDRFKEVNGLDVDVPNNLCESYADGVTISEKSKYHYKGSWLTDSGEVERVFATTVNIGFGKYNTYYAQAAFSCPEELYLTIEHEYLHLELFKLGYTQKLFKNG